MTSLISNNRSLMVYFQIKLQEVLFLSDSMPHRLGRILFDFQHCASIGIIVFMFEEAFCAILVPRDTPQRIRLCSVTD